jgi:hypothetical protein
MAQNAIWALSISLQITCDHCGHVGAVQGILLHMKSPLYDAQYPGPLDWSAIDRLIWAMPTGDVQVSHGTDLYLDAECTDRSCPAPRLPAAIPAERRSFALQLKCIDLLGFTLSAWISHQLWDLQMYDTLCSGNE